MPPPEAPAEPAGTNAAPRLRFDLLLYLANRVVARLPFHAVRASFYRRCMKFEIAPGGRIFMDAWFDMRGGFSLGRDSVINQRCRLDNRGGIRIGDCVSISAEVCILTADHDLQDASFAGRHRPVVIEDFVFIGTGALILPGVTLGRGSAVGAGSVVTRDVEPFVIVAGNPARPIGRRPVDLAYRCDYRRWFA